MLRGGFGFAVAAPLTVMEVVAVDEEGGVDEEPKVGLVFVKGMEESVEFGEQEPAVAAAQGAGFVELGGEMGAGSAAEIFGGALAVETLGTTVDGATVF